MKYAKNTVLWIEEVHEFLAVGDAGSVPYGFGTGYRSGFDAKVALRFREWMKIQKNLPSENGLEYCMQIC